MENMDIYSAIAHLEQHILMYSSSDYILDNIHSARDIYENRVVLKCIAADDRAVSHIAGVIVQTIEEQKRMRTYECLKVLRALTKSVIDTRFATNTIDKLFKIYQKFVFSNNEDVRWCVSAILKDKELSEQAIDWLIDNASVSEHIVNRLLLYPVSHPKIVAWAQDLYESDQLLDRLSEVIAILLTPEIADDIAVNVDPDTMLWAIYKSRLTRLDKIDLLKRYCCLESCYSLIDIVDRIQEPSLLHHLLVQLQSKVSVS